MNLLAELRRRSVFRVGAAYLISGWVVMQVVALIADASGLPEWTTSFVLILVIAGLPIALIIAWAFEVTPEGVKQTEKNTEAAAGAASVRPFSLTDGILVAGLVMVLGFMGVQQFLGTPQQSAGEVARMEGQSIAVLPFVAISDAPEDIILGDGLAEELLNVLAQFPDLMVAGRTSSFSFRDQAQDITGIGAALGVSHVLEGSVRRAEDQIRVTAQLIRASDGFHIWSGTYDRPFADILQVQDDIVHQIAQMLTVRLGIGATARENVQTTNPAAYEKYLQGRYLFAARNVGNNRFAAIEALQTAVDIDPDFAAAWAALARAIVYSSPQGGAGALAFYGRGRRAAERALSLDPDNAEALASLGYYWTRPGERDWDRAVEYLDRALERAPNAAFAHYTQALAMEFFGDDERLAAALRRAMALDPLNQTIRRNAAGKYLQMGRFVEAQHLIDGTQMDDRNRAYMLVASALAQWDGSTMTQAAQDLATAMRDDPQSDDGETSVYIELFFSYGEAMAGNIEAAEQRLPALLVHVEAGILNDADLGEFYYFQGKTAEAAQHFLVAANDLSEDVLDYIFRNPRNPHARALRCEPDYHTLWQSQGMPELGEIRRAIGATSMLPLSGTTCE